MPLSRIVRYGAMPMAIAALVAFSWRVEAQDTTFVRGTAQHAASTDTSAIDPDAIAALEKMGAYLRTLRSFGVHAAVTTEDVMDDGEKVQQTSTLDLVAARPNRLRLEIADEHQPRTLYYDGKTFTLWAPRVKFYAAVAAPPTILELADTLDDKYDLELPFVDLFRWGTPESDVADITQATDIGPSAVSGVTCEQYAFRQDGLDWQVWIQNGDFPLPLRLVLTTTSDDARPQHTSVYTWNLAPSFNDAAFVFTPPADAKKISFEEVAAARADKAKEKKSGGKK